MISRKSIRVVVMVAALSALLAGCGNDDDEKPNGGPESLGGHVGENPFKGLTIVSEEKDSHGGETETYIFTSNTKGVYRHEYLDFDYEEYSYSYQCDFEYVVDSTRNMLKYRATQDTTDGKTQTLNDKYLAETYGNLDDKTKSIIYDSFINYVHYDFTDDGSGVELDSDYYFGSMAESSADFVCDDYASRVAFWISNFMRFSIFRGDGHSYYICYPKFASDGSFTAVVFEVIETYNDDDDTYEKVSTKLAGVCQITGTGTNCTGTVKFTHIPDEMKAGDDGKGLVLDKEYLLEQHSELKLYTIQANN